MTEAKRRITITKRVSLADFGEGWDACYAIVTPADYATYRAIQDADVQKMSQAESIMFTMDTVKKHFVHGTIKVLNEDKEYVLTPMTVEDIDASLELSNRLYAEIMGLKLDPKGSSGAAPSEQPPTSSEVTTATSSSMESQKESPSTSSGTSGSSDTSNVADSLNKTD